MKSKKEYIDDLIAFMNESVCNFFAVKTMRQTYA